MSDCGCDEDEFAALATAPEVDDGTDLTADPRGDKVRKWSGLLAPYGVPTGDKRRFAAGALSSRDLPLPLKWQRADESGHSTSVTVGRIDGLDYRDDGVYGSGIVFDPDPERMPRWAEDCNEAYGLLKEKVVGPSVDLDDMDYRQLDVSPELAAADMERPEIEVTRGRISAATLVQIPAFAEARPFTLEEVDAVAYASDTSLTAAGVLDLPGGFAVANDEWDPLHWMAFDAGTPGAALYSGAEGVFFPIAGTVDGQLKVYPDAVADAISVLAFKADTVQLGEGVKQAMRDRLTDLAEALELPAPPWTQPSPALVASGDGPKEWRPAREAFEDPKFEQLTPITVKDGRVYGHLASWQACHIGFKHCVKAPKSRTQYAHFHVGEIETDKGPLAVGKITLGGGHADTQLGFKAAAEHYDDAGTAVAAVRAGEDKFGIWVAGVPIPGAEEKFSTLPLYPLSGDWRRVGGSMELVAALAVNTPGFGITRGHEAAGQLHSLVAAGVVGDFANLSVKGREASARKGHALPDGSFPIENVSDLQNAIAAYGRAKDKEAVKRLIMRRARELKREDLIPDGWRGKGGGDYSVDDLATAFQLAQRRERTAGALADTLGAEFAALDVLERREAALQAVREF